MYCTSKVLLGPLGPLLRDLAAASGPHLSHCVPLAWVPFVPPIAPLAAAAGLYPAPLKSCCLPAPAYPPCLLSSFPSAAPPGNNQLSQLEDIGYLCRLPGLNLINLAGNPLCKDHDYQSYVLSHLQHLSYLDYRRVSAPDVALAVERHQVRGPVGAGRV